MGPMNLGRRGIRAALAAAVASTLALAGCGAPDSEPTPATTASTAETTDPPTAETSTPAETTEAPTTEPAPEVEQDPELAAVLEPLVVEGLPPLSLVASDDVAADCGVEAGGCYVPDEATIYVTSEWTDFRRPELLAHEYLHHVWERDALGDDDELTAALDEAFSDEEGLGALVPSWQEDYVTDDGSVLPTELFSYACTGLRTDQLAGVVAERCGEYLHMDELPVAQTITAGPLLDQVDALRQAEGLEPMERNPHAAAASEARAALFTPYSQVPLDEYPESVTQHLDAGCAPARYGARLTRVSSPEQMVADLDALLDGALTSSQYTGVGMVVTEFDHIDARELFGERTLRVNTTLVVVTVCG